MSTGIWDITDADLITEVRSLAKLDPDMTSDCQYTVADMDDNDEPTISPECIMGHAWFNFGVDLETLFSMEDQPVAEHLHDSDSPEVRWLADVQSRQDNGHTWGVAVEMADAAVADASEEDA